MNEPDVRLLEEFFLEAAAATYAGGAQKSTIPELPKSKVYRYERSNLLYVDTYFTNGEYSGGKTLIFADNVPVWMMDYDGWCKNDDKRVTEFLKRALSAAYSTRQFVGGRGPGCFLTEVENEEGLAYQNNYDSYHWDFAFFQGRERIYRLPDKITSLFWHRYKGLLLYGDMVRNTAKSTVVFASRY